MIVHPFPPAPGSSTRKTAKAVDQLCRGGGFPPLPHFFQSAPPRRVGSGAEAGGVGKRQDGLLDLHVALDGILGVFEGGVQFECKGKTSPQPPTPSFGLSSTRRFCALLRLTVAIVNTSRRGMSNQWIRIPWMTRFKVLAGLSITVALPTCMWTRLSCGQRQ